MTSHVRIQYNLSAPGYYARSAALKHLILDFLQFESKGQKKQILSLGAGYDTTWFHLKVTCMFIENQ